MAGRLSYDAIRSTGIEASIPISSDMPNRRSSPPVRSSMRSTSLEPAKLQKPLPASKHARAASGQYLTPNSHAVPSLQEFKQQYAGTHHLSIPGQQPTLPHIQMGVSLSRDPSLDRNLPVTPTSTSSRPTTPNYSAKIAPSTPSSTGSKISHTPPSTNASHSTEKLHKKHGWFGKKKDKPEAQAPLAWIAGHNEKVVYDVQGLVQGQPAMEIWDNVEGDCWVHLFPPNFDKEASFKIDSSIIQASAVLSKITATNTIAPNVPPQDVHLYLQLKLSHAAVIHGSPHSTADPTPQDIQTIVDYRNLFAFLCGSSLVATDQRSSLFSIFIAIGSLLKSYEFSNVDGSTFGDVANSSFENYVDELGLADVRSSREKTIQGIILGERMRCASLYTEAFTHAVGKLSDILALKNAKFDMISTTTRSRLTRGALELEKREQAIQLTLKDFDFPSIFSGIMNSKTSEERKEGVRFDAWKEAFFNTRKWMLSTLKQQYGDWPPKAKSKKNDLEVSGLQRQVLSKLYEDLCSVYDLVVDRTHLTTRTLDGIDRAGPVEAPWIRALRSVLSEYDRSSPPVKPPMPFDLPKLPGLANTSLATKKLKDEEIAVVLRASWNEDALVTPFVNAFRDMERRAAHGCSSQEIMDLRMGQWIFMYAVMQALPMLVSDAPGLKYRNDVEYFLCIPPRDGMPWVDSQKAPNRRTWFSVGDAGGVVSLPSHLIEHSTEGIYKRSHCWEMAEKWAAANPILNQALQEQTAAAATMAEADKLPLSQKGYRGRSASPVKSYKNSSLQLGLEALSLSPGGNTAEGSQPVSTAAVEHKVDSKKTFDAIFATMDNAKPSRKK